MQTWKKLKNDSQLWHRYWVREKVVDAIREYFKNQGFHEVETPLLIPNPSTEPFLEVFETRLKFDEGDSYRAFLPSSPEFAMKKLLAAGSGSIFQICKSFRNGEGRSVRHNPEFSILEWYRTPGGYEEIMRDFEGLMLQILKKVKGDESGTKLVYQGKEYDLVSPWERVSVAWAFDKYAGVSVDELVDEKKLLNKAKEKGYKVDKTTTWEQAYNQIFLNEIEPKLGLTGPTIIYDYPVAQAALSKRKESDPRFAERFEVYLAGLELGNAFSELTDAVEQEARCVEDLEERKKLGKTEYELDRDFIEALKTGMPETGGIAVGVDRLVMLFADAIGIEDVLFFPIGEIFQ